MVSAQAAADQRAVTTKIADVLAAMPAPDKVQLNKNMELVAAIGEAGVAEMASMLMPSGKGDNTSLEFAIAGYSAYVTQPGKESQRQAAVKAYCTALDKLADRWNKEFIIRQLQITGNDDAIPSLQKYLADEQLSGSATRALAHIHTPAAEKVLLGAVQQSKGVNQLAIIEALGYSRYKPALSVLAPLAENSDKEVRKVVLYALARIADPASSGVMSAAAKKAGYTFDDSNATSAYLYYLQQLNKNGGGAEAEKLATELMAQSASANQLHTRTAALSLLVANKKENSLPLLMQAMKDSSSEYRAAALSFAAPYQSPPVNKQWLATMASATPAAKAQIIRLLGTTGDQSLVAPLTAALKQKDTAVKIAAITAIGRLGQQSALPVLLPLLKNGTAPENDAIVSAIQTMKGDEVTTQVAAAMDKTSPAGKAALVRVLASRGADQFAPRIFDQLTSTDPTLRAAAVQSLPFISKQENLPQLFTLLNGATSPDEIIQIQRAIVSATAGVTDTAQRTALITDQLKTFGGKQYLLLDVLGTIGGKEALKQLYTAFEQGDERAKKAAVSALSKAGGPGAAMALLTIARQPATSATQSALAGYIQLISKSSFTADQKLLMLREAMALSDNDAQRKTIMREVSRCNTFLAMLYAGKFLDDAAVQGEAANAVSVIGLANPEFTGANVRALMTKAGDLLKGGDADYQKKAVAKHLAEMPAGEGFVPLFNEKDLTGWKGLVADPVKRAKMDAATLAAEQEKADKEMAGGWEAKDGLLVFTGHGNNLATTKKYGNFEMFVDWKITKDGDAGIYLRGSPQVQIWDTARRNVGAQVGSGGLYNNQKNPSKPLKVADNPVGEWNTFHIIMKGDKVTVFLNGELVTDSVTLENYWDRNLPIYPSEQLELQAHGTNVAYRNLYLRELPGSPPFELSEEEKKEGYTVLFDGSNLDKWTGNKTDYTVDNGDILVSQRGGGHGNLYTQDEYSDFVFRFEFQLTPGANNGLGIRTPMEGDAAYVGMELQILDDTADIYKNLKPYQYHGSIYGIIPSKKGFLKPVGEWNYEEVIAKGSKIKVILNNEVILDGDIKQAVKKGTADGKEHPGLRNAKGHIGFLGHGSALRFRNIRMKEIKK